MGALRWVDRSTRGLPPDPFTEQTQLFGAFIRLGREGTAPVVILVGPAEFDRFRGGPLEMARMAVGPGDRRAIAMPNRGIIPPLIPVIIRREAIRRHRAFIDENQPLRRCRRRDVRSLLDPKHRLANPCARGRDVVASGTDAGTAVVGIQPVHRIHHGVGDKLELSAGRTLITALVAAHRPQVPS